MVLLNIGTTTFILYIGGIENTEKCGMVFPWWYRKCKGDNGDDDASHTNRRRYSFYKMHSWQKNK